MAFPCQTVDIWTPRYFYFSLSSILMLDWESSMLCWDLNHLQIPDWQSSVHTRSYMCFVWRSVCVLLSHFSRVWLFVDCSPPGSPVHRDSTGKKTGVGCHVLLQGDFPNPGIKPRSLMFPALAGGFITTSTTWEALSDWESHDFLHHTHSCIYPIIHLFNKHSGHLFYSNYLETRDTLILKKKDKTPYP